MSGIGPKADVAAAMARWPAEPYIPAMMTEDLRALAQRIVERMIQEHPDVASEIAAQVLTELLAACLFNDDEAAVADFVQAINWKLAEIALRHGADRAWLLVPCDPPTRQ